jgi:hypothetical protein
MIKETLCRNLELLRAALAGPNPTPIERLLVQRVVACWLQVQNASLRYIAKKQVNVVGPCVATDGLTIDRGEPGRILHREPTVADCTYRRRKAPKPKSSNNSPRAMQNNPQTRPFGPRTDDPTPTRKNMMAAIM